MRGFLFILLFVHLFSGCRDKENQVNSGGDNREQSAITDDSHVREYHDKFILIWEAGGGSFIKFESSELDREKAKAIAAYIHINVMLYGVELWSVTPKTSQGDEGPDPSTGVEHERFVKLRRSAYSILDLKNWKEIDSIFDNYDKLLFRKDKWNDDDWKLNRSLNDRYRQLFDSSVF